MGAGKAAAGVIVAILVLGFGYYFYQMYTVSQNISISEVSVDDIELLGFNPRALDFYPEEIEFSARILVDNPSDYSVTVDELRYQIYIEGNYLGEGSKSDIFIPAHSNTPVYVTLDTRTSDILRIIEDGVKRGDNAVDYEVKGYVTVPIKFFGAIRISSIEVPFDESGVYVIPIELPGIKPDVKFLEVYWSNTIGSIGNVSKVVVEVTGRISGNLEVVIKKDIPMLPDETVYSEILYVDVPESVTETYTIDFSPPDPSGLTLRGYHIEVLMNGQKIFVQPEKYPPRLKVKG